MLINREILTADFENFKIFDNIEDNFSKSILISSKLYEKIKTSYQRTLNNRAKFFLGSFQLTIFNIVENIVNNCDDYEVDFIEDLTDFISVYFKKTDQNLNIKNKKDFEEFIIILKLSSLILKNAMIDNNLDLIYESFYQIQSRLKKENLLIDFRKNDNVFIEINFENDSNSFSRDVIVDNNSLFFQKFIMQ